jgi:hypothetical protein
VGVTELKLVPRPEGFELRDRRSDKSGQANDWTPRDALFDASEAIGDDAEAVTIVWRKPNGRGGFEYFRRNAGPKGASVDLTVTALGLEMGWTR